jgi:hypothetical protein
VAGGCSSPPRLVEASQASTFRLPPQTMIPTLRFPVSSRFDKTTQTASVVDGCESAGRGRSIVMPPMGVETNRHHGTAQGTSCQTWIGGRLHKTLFKYELLVSLCGLVGLVCALDLPRTFSKSSKSPTVSFPSP